MRLLKKGITESIYRNLDSKPIYEAKKTKRKVKSKKPKDEKRVIMQQGNVTCFRDGKTYFVFENEKDNEKTYSSQEEAMQDFFSRVGVDPTQELEEPKK